MRRAQNFALTAPLQWQKSGNWVNEFGRRDRRRFKHVRANGLIFTTI